MSTGSSSSICQGAKGGKPCVNHTRSARSRYRTKLEALGCICSALIALGQESCCTSGYRSSGESERSLNLRSRSSTSVKTLSAGKDTKRAHVSVARHRPQFQGGLESSPRVQPACSKGCCASSQARDPIPPRPCADSCCGEKDSAAAAMARVQEALVESALPDPEKSSVANKEHVVLAISGMTCTGCETKLQRTLGTLRPVTNLKTSLVLARAVFDISGGNLTPEDVIKHLERTTEFKCERVNFETSSLDLAFNEDAQHLINGPWPKGVTDIKVMDKGKTIRVEYDPQITGARNLVEKSWDEPMKLAASQADPGLEIGSKHVRHMGLMTLLSIALTIPVLVMSWAPLPDKEIAYGSASLALATVVQFVVAGPFYPKALKSLVFSRIIEMDLLIVLSTSAAYIFSVVSFGLLLKGQPLSTGEFFETSTLLVTLIMVGRYVAALARQKAVESISIRSLQTPTATVVDDYGVEREIDARLLQLGDVFKVAPDSKVPTDGIVVSGDSEADEAMLTGESMPVEKHPSSAVVAGSINGSGTLTVRLTRLPEHNTISTIAFMVDEAKLSKPKIQEVADRVATYFVPVIIGLTIIALVAWVAVGVAVRGQSGRDAAIRAVTYAITVLIVSCPCAIGLAVPMVIVISTGIAAERGVIVKTSQAIEAAYRTSHVVFDKTGTLTEGKLSVAGEAYFGDDTINTKSMLLGLISQNKHPVSVAVANHLKSQGVGPTEIPNAKVVTGKGIEGDLGFPLRAGHSRWLNMTGNSYVQAMLSNGLTVFCLTMDNSPAAVFGLEDAVRPDAISTVSELQRRNISVHVLSGDDDGAVRSITSRLNIPGDRVVSRCSPADKQAYLHGLSNPTPEPSQTPGGPVVIFCGDGTNDAVALAGATIGIHMNGGTDVAQSAADVVLVRPDLSKILTIIAISRKSMHRIAFNFTWSFVYNLFAILLASGALVHARIPPEYAGLGELVSVLPVILAAALLRWSKV